MPHTQPPPPPPVRPHTPSTTDPPSRAQPAAEHHRSPLRSSRLPPRPPLPIPTTTGQHRRPGRPGRQRPRQMPRWHAAPPGQLPLRHLVEEHLAVRTYITSSGHGVRPLPPCRQVGHLQPVASRHPVQKRPCGFPLNRCHPQDRLHGIAFCSGGTVQPDCQVTLAKLARGTRGFSRPLGGRVRSVQAMTCRVSLMPGRRRRLCCVLPGARPTGGLGKEVQEQKRWAVRRVPGRGRRHRPPGPCRRTPVPAV
jgi:hypothetical protein